MRPVLEVIGSNTVYVGEGVGQGQTLKLVNNLLAATTWAAGSRRWRWRPRPGSTRS